MTSPIEDPERFGVEQSKTLSRRILDEINTYWSSQPTIAIYALYEITGAIASAYMTHDDARRREFILGMTDALRARIVRESELLNRSSKES